MSKEKIIAGVVVLVVLVGIGYSYMGKSKKPVVSETPKVETVATVNGIDITKAAYESQLAAAITTLKSQGVNTDDANQLSAIKNQVLNGLIGNELLNQAVKASGVTATAEEIEKGFQTVMSNTGGADKLQAELAKNNMTEAQLRENIAKQLATQKYLLSKIDISTATASDAEVTKFYNDNLKGKAGAPALKDVSAQIKQQIINTKQQQLLAAFIQTLRQAAKVETASM